MSQSNHVVGFKPPDAKFKKMYAIWKACVAAEVQVPAEVDAFFGLDGPDSSGTGVKICLEDNDAVTRFEAEMQDGWEVDLRKLDPDIKILRFYVSY